MKRRILALLMALVIVIGIVPVSSFAADESVVIETGHVAEFITQIFLSRIELKGVSGTVSGAGENWAIELAEDTDMTQPITLELTGAVPASRKASLYFWANGVPGETSLADADPGTVTVMPVWENGRATLILGVGTATKLQGTKYTLELSIKGLAKEDFNAVKLGETGDYKAFVTKVDLEGAVATASSVSDTDFSGSTSGHKATVTYELDAMPSEPVRLTFTMASSSSSYVDYNDSGTRTKVTGTYTTELDLNKGLVHVFKTYSTKSNSTIRGTYTIRFQVAGQNSNTAPELTGEKSEERTLYTGQSYDVDLSAIFRDPELDSLTYTVSVNGTEAVKADSKYSFAPDKAGEYTLVFHANDGKLTSEVDYTVFLTVKDNTAPTLTGEASGTETVDQYSTFTLDLSKIFADAEGDALSYTVSVNGGTATATGASCSYTPQTAEALTLVFQAKDHSLTSPEYTLLLKVNEVKKTTVTTSCAKLHNYDSWLGSIEIYADVLSFEWSVAEGHDESEIHTLSVQLSGETPDDAVLTLKYVEKRNTNSVGGSISGPSSVTLVDGQGSVTVKSSPRLTSWGAERTYQLNFTNKVNSAPTAAATSEVSLNTGDVFSLDLSKVFTDPDGEKLIYTLGAEGQVESSFRRKISTSGKHTFVFTAEDPWGAKAVHTVTVTATPNTNTYNATVKIPEGITPSFYIAGDDNACGDSLTATAGTAAGGFVPYTVTVPENVTRISFRGKDTEGNNWGGMTAAVSKDMEPVTVIKLLGVIPSRVNGQYATAEQAVFRLKDKDGYYAVCGSTTTDSYGITNFRFLAVAFGTDDLANAYTTYVTPQGELTATYVETVGINKTFVKDVPQQITQLGLTLKSGFVVTVPKGATVQAFQWKQYYKAVEIPVSDTVENADGTVNWMFVKSDANRMTYRASMEGKITKVGYVNGDSVAITWDENDPSPDCRTPYDTSTLYGSRGDDSIVVNVNGQNNLRLENGGTFRLRGYRIWEVINSDTQNVMIQPDMHYTLTGDDIVTVTPVTSGNGNGKNNWLDLQATGNGVAYLELSYDAMQVVTGNQSSFGGEELGGFVFNACDPARTALVVVQVGNAATDVSFGIQCASYLGSTQVPWDVEFDTLYFIGDSGQLQLSPSVTSGAIAKVEVSGDKGATWTELTAEGGVYTAPIVSGNNIIRVTKTDGTQAHQVVRGDKVTYTLTETDGDGDNIPEAGETYRLQLHGIHNPIGKMSGNYNPGYGGGQQLNYKWNGTSVYTKGGYQYDFVTNAYVDIQIPADAKSGDSLSLTNGYIGFVVTGIAEFTNDTANHRGIGDDGCSSRGSGGTSHQRSLLPVITVTVRDSKADVQSVIDGIKAIGTVTLEDEAAIARARAEYNQLTAGQKEQVDPALVAELEAAEKTLVVLKDQAAAAQVDTKIAAIGEVKLEDEGAIIAARNAYNALTADQKKLVTKLAVLEQAEKELAVLKATGGVDYGLSPDEIVGYVTISFVDYGVRVEGEKIGAAYQNPRGVIIAPTKVPFKPYDTIATVTLRLLASKGIGASYTGDEFSGFYLSAVGDLAEFSAGSGSGWMVTQNGWFINKGASEFTVADGDVIAWQYTCQLGKDIGDSSYFASVEETIKLIDAIGTVTLDSKEKIQAARVAYDKLTQQEQKRVTNLDKLTAAEKKLAELEATEEDKKAAEAVTKLIDAIGTVSLDSQEKIQAARQEYDGLTDIQKLLVENYHVLVKAENTLAQLQAAGMLREIYTTTGDYLENLGTPGVNAVGGEWMVIGVARSGRPVPDGYYDNVLSFVQENIDENGRLHSTKSTENARVILALTALGKDVTNVDGHNLLLGLADMDYIQKQGINGPIWALIAFDSGNYSIPEGNVTREALIQVILDAQLSDGGWALSGSVSDPDMTGMALQALAPYYKTNAEVKAAVDKALIMLTNTQGDDGGFASIDGTNSESVAQVIVALTALGIDPATDERFVKNGISLVDALCSYYVEGGGFRHTPDGQLDGMATEQGYYALTAYYRFQAGKTGLYDMTDVIDMGGKAVVPQKFQSGQDDTKFAVWWIILPVAPVVAAAVAVILKKRKK